MFKKEKIVAIGLLSLSATIFVQPTLALEDGANDSNAPFSEIDSRATYEDKTLKEELKALSAILNSNMIKSGELSPDDKLSANQTNPSIRYTIPVVIENDKISVNKGKSSAVRTQVFSNTSGADNTLPTPVFNFNYKDSVTAMTNRTTNVAYQVEKELKLPFQMDGSTSINARYDYDSIKPLTTTSTKNWIVTQDRLYIPAGKKYKVEWLVNTGVARGDVKLTSQVEGLLPYKPRGTGTSKYEFYSAIRVQRELENELPGAEKWEGEDKWLITKRAEAFRIWGTGSFTAEYVNGLTRNVYDITNGESNAPLVESALVNMVSTN
ncbi:ETX/MTX2 family pore-forming toxin [Streptococcaceae bacterium ESL0687]|nr:ETX/MTX2 family pore-forming toxin [Streptococcaceae bacterium ESL0687]